MSKEPGQAAYEAWVEVYSPDKKFTPWSWLEPRMKKALAHQEQVIRELERAAVVRHLRSMGHHIAAGDIEAGKHREEE